MLRIDLLGPFRLRDAGGADLAFPTHSTAAVLALLALHPGRRFSRASLAQTLWPDYDPERSTANLRQALWRLRTVMGEGAGHLVTNRVEVWLQPSPELVIDLEEFLRTGAPDLVRGPLLEGWEDEWVLSQREALQEQVLRRLGEAASRCLTDGRSGEALQLGRRLVALDPLREEGHRAIMAAHMALGERSAALQQYRTCQSLLAEELGVAPAPETQALAAEARALGAGAGGAGPGGTSPSPGHLVGRQAELDRLSRAVLGQGETQVILLGEPGIGKSALLAAAAGVARDAGMQVLATACHDGPAPPPYQLMADLLRAAGSTWLRSLPAGVAAALSLILPELGPPTRTTPGEDRHRLLTAIGDAVQALSRGAPLLLALEDLQWSDPASIAALELIWPRLEGRKLRLVATCRQDALAEREDIRAWIERQGARGALAQLRLEGLDSSDTAALASRLDPDSSPLFLSWLYMETGGNPLFIQELVRAARHQPEVPPPELPPGIQRVIRGRLLGLPEEARQILRGAAVLGEHFSSDELRLILDLPDAELLQQVEDLLMRGLIVEESAGYRFFHTRFREAVLGDLTLVRRQALHRRAARVVRTPAAAAYHAVAAQDWPLAAARLMEAAQEAMGVGALETAVELFGQAREAARRFPDGEPQAVRALLLQERALSFMVRPREQTAVLDQLLRMAEQRDDAALAVQVAARRSMMLSRDWLLDEADAEAERAVILARRPGIPPERLVEAQLHLAHLDFVRGRFRRSQLLSTQALESARQAGSLFWEGRALRRLAQSYYVTGRYDRMRQKAQGAQEIARRLGDISLQISAERHLITAALRAGEVEQALATALGHVELARRIGYRLAEAYAYAVLAETYRLACRPEKSGPWAAKAAEMEGHLHEPLLTFWAHRELAWDRLHHGDFHQALRHVETGLETVRRFGSAHYAFQMTGIGVRVNLALGETAQALSWARQQHPVCTALTPQANLETCLLASRAWLAAGEPAAARRWLRWLRKWRLLLGAGCIGRLGQEADQLLADNAKAHDR